MMEDKLARVSSIGQDHIEKRSKAVISLARTQIHKFTKDHWGTVPIRWCLFFWVVLLANGPQIIHKCTNSCSRLIDLSHNI